MRSSKIDAFIRARYSFPSLQGFLPVGITGAAIYTANDGDFVVADVAICGDHRNTCEQHRRPWGQNNFALTSQCIEQTHISPLSIAVSANCCGACCVKGISLRESVFAAPKFHLSSRCSRSDRQQLPNMLYIRSLKGSRLGQLPHRCVIAQQPQAMIVTPGRGYDVMAACQLPKLNARVRFPLPAPTFTPRENASTASGPAPGSSSRGRRRREPWGASACARRRAGRRSGRARG